MEKKVSGYFWTDLQNLVCASIALVYFIYVIAFDLWGGCKRRTYWIPGKFLVLSALTIQALSYLDVTSVNLSDNPSTWGIAMLLGNHLLIDNGRLIICVFMGYLLPGMGKDQWGDVLALAITLFSNIASELYFLYKSKYLFNYIHDYFSDYQFDYDFEYDVLSHLQQQPSLQIWYNASSLGTVVSVVFLLFLLGSAILTGSTIRETLSQRIAAALTVTAEGGEEKSREEDLKEFEEKVFKSWLLAHVCRPDYVIARSVMSSAAGMVVTLRIVFSLLKLKFLKYIHIVEYNDGLDRLRVAVLMIQFIFIFVGWIAICCRWITALIYFPKSDGMKNVFRVEDFWRRRIMELRYGWQSQIADLKEEKKNDPTADEFLLDLKILLFTIAEKCLPDVLRVLQTLVVFFGKVCWLLSWIVVGNRFSRRWLVRDPSKEFHEYNDILKRVSMPEETKDQLRIANLKAIKQTKKLMEKGTKTGRGCGELINYIRENVSEPKFEPSKIVKDSFPSLEKMCWMMTAVSYFEIIVEVLPKRKEKTKKVLDQAADIMNFLDRIDIEVDEEGLLNSLGRAADREFQRVKEAIPPRKNAQSVSEAKERIEKLVKEHEKHLEENSTMLVHHGAMDVKKTAHSYSVCNVGKYLLKTIDKVEDPTKMGPIIEEAFSNLIGYCVLQVKVQLENKCIEWARGFEEDMLWKAAYIAGKVKGVLQDSKVSLKRTDATNT